MKKRLFSILTIVCITLFYACQKEISVDDIIDPPVLVQGNFTAKIDAVQWVANNIKFATRQNNVLVLYGSATDKKSIIIRVQDSGVYNYTFNSESFNNFSAFTDSAILPIASFATNQWQTKGNYGNLNVTAIDTTNKTMSGTFSMEVYRQLDSLQRNITQGVFTNIPYSTSPTPTALTDTFRVKIAGIDFTYNILSGVNFFGKINVSASQNAAPSVGVSLPYNITAGIYPFDIFDYVCIYNPSSTVFLGADTGSLTILEHNLITRRIRGNFNFLANTPFTHAPPNVQLTQGYFSVKYQ